MIQESTLSSICIANLESLKIQSLGKLNMKSSKHPSFCHLNLPEIPRGVVQIVGVYDTAYDVVEQYPTLFSRHRSVGRGRCKNQSNSKYPTNRWKSTNIERICHKREKSWDDYPVLIMMAKVQSLSLRCNHSFGYDHRKVFNQVFAWQRISYIYLTSDQHY